MINFVKLLLLGIVIALVPLQAQITFERWYGGTSDDCGYAGAQTADGGYIITGYTMSYGLDGNVYLVKTDSLGDTLWTRSYGGSYTNQGYSVIQTQDSGFIIAGEVYSIDSMYNVWLIKTDPAGDTVWTKTYGGLDNEWPNSMVKTNDDGYIIAGITYAYTNGDAYVIKTDSLGDTLWTRHFGGPSYDYATDIIQARDSSGYVIIGSTDSYGAGNTDLYCLKISLNGGLVWSKTFGGVEFDVGSSIAQTLDGGYIITGNTYSYGNGGSDVYLIKTNATGDTIWTRTYGGSDWDGGSSVLQAADNGYIIVGLTTSYSTYGQVYFIKTNSYGDTVWTRLYGGDSTEAAGDLIQTTDGGYAIVGNTYSYGAGLSDVYFIKTDANGIVHRIEETGTLTPIQNIIVKPNPFSNWTDIRFTIHNTRNTMQDAWGTTLLIFDVSGRLVKDLSSDLESYIMDHVSWSGTDQSGHEVPDGVYFVRLLNGKFSKTVKIVKTH